VILCSLIDWVSWNILIAKGQKPRTRGEISSKFCNFWQTYTWIDSQQNNACTVHNTYYVFLHYLVEIILSVFCAVSRWNLLMNYVTKQLNSVNHTKLYWSVYKQCSVCTDERDMPVCRAISRGLSAVCLPDYRSARLRSRRFRWFEQILDVRCPAFSSTFPHLIWKFNYHPRWAPTCMSAQITDQTTVLSIQAPHYYKSY